MTTLNILNRSQYTDLCIRGSEKIYYGSYPYKVKLKDNSINYSWQSAGSIQNWIYSPNAHSNPSVWKRRFHTKSVSNWSRNFYFSDIDVFNDFVEEFKPDIEYCYGPISDEHVSALLTVKQENRYGSDIHVVKGNYYFNEFDMKLVWQYPTLLNDSRFYGRGYKKTINYFEELGNALVDMTENNARWYYRNAYIKSEDLADIQFYIKLKYGDVIDQRVKVIFIENM